MSGYAKEHGPIVARPSPDDGKNATAPGDAPGAAAVTRFA
jgi:hypothetical protein